MRVIGVTQFRGMCKARCQVERGWRRTHEVRPIALLPGSYDLDWNLNARDLRVNVRLGRRAVLVNAGLDLRRACQHEAIALRKQPVFAVIAQDTSIPTVKRRPVFETRVHLLRRLPAIAPLGHELRLRPWPGVFSLRPDHRIE